MLSGIYSISTPSDSPGASGSWTDGLRRYLEFNEAAITVYYELTCRVKVPVNNSIDADIIDEGGNYYRIDEVVSYFKSIDALDKNLQFDCDKDIVNTNAIYYSGPVFQYNVKERSDNEIVLTRSNDIVVLSAIKDELKLKSLKAAQESDYNDIKCICWNFNR